MGNVRGTLPDFTWIDVTGEQVSKFVLRTMTTGKPAESEAQGVWRGLRRPKTYICSEVATKTTYGRGIANI